MKVLLVLSYALLICSTFSLNQRDLTKINNYIRKNKNLGELGALIPIGSMGGYFKNADFWQLHSYLQKQFPTLVSLPVSIGKSYNKNDIFFFKVGDDINNANRPKKSALLFTALHHSREFTSLSVLITAFIDTIKNLYHQKNSKGDLLKSQLDVLFIPVVNIDSFKYIGSRWGKENWSSARMIRKNRNLSYGCQDVFKAGVDLNRNYGFKYGSHFSHGSSNMPCAEDYRGPHAFSEPETLAMKHFIESHPEIKSAMNFHAYGDMLISPYNFERGPNEHLLRSTPRYYNVYKEFKDAPHRNKTLFGKAFVVIKYSANGEASDWMLAKHKIIAFSPEVGVDNDWAQHFLIPNTKAHLPFLINGFYPTIDYFIKMHSTQIKEISSRTDGSSMVISLYNSGLSTLYNTKLVLKVHSKTHQVKNVFISFKNENNKNKLQKKTLMGINVRDNSGSISMNLKRRIGINLHVVFKNDLRGARPKWEFSVKKDNTPIAKVSNTNKLMVVKKK